MGTWGWWTWWSSTLAKSGGFDSVAQRDLACALLCEQLCASSLPGVAGRFLGKLMDSMLTKSPRVFLCAVHEPLAMLCCAHASRIRAACTHAGQAAIGSAAYAVEHWLETCAQHVPGQPLLPSGVCADLTTRASPQALVLAVHLSRQLCTARPLAVLMHKPTGTACSYTARCHFLSAPAGTP